MNNRNNSRVLSEQQVIDVKTQLAADTKMWADDVAEALLNYYLTGNHEDFYTTVTNWVEAAEDAVIDTINSELSEDSFNNSL